MRGFDGSVDSRRVDTRITVPKRVPPPTARHARRGPSGRHPRGNPTPRATGRGSRRQSRLAPRFGRFRQAVQRRMQRANRSPPCSPRFRGGVRVPSAPMNFTKTPTLSGFLHIQRTVSRREGPTGVQRPHCGFAGRDLGRTQVRCRFSVPTRTPEPRTSSASSWDCPIPSGREWPSWASP